MTTTAWHLLIAQIQSKLRDRGIHPAQAVVLLPFAQLLPLAHKAWRELAGSGFAPRFETTRTWVEQLPPSAHPANGPSASNAIGFRHNTRLDWFIAAHLLRESGLGKHWGQKNNSETSSITVFIPKLLQATQQLIAVYAATPPLQRLAWSRQAQALLISDAPEHELLYIESALCRIALAWTLSTDFASDSLWPALASSTQTPCLLLVEGLEDAATWSQGIQATAGERCVRLRLGELGAQNTKSALVLHNCTHAEDEVFKTAACVLVHVQAGRLPVALASTDRSLTRRVRALLALQGARIIDETGWKLSTTHAAAQVMNLVRTSIQNEVSSSADEVLDALKNSPSLSAGLLHEIEAVWRQTGNISLSNLAELHRSGNNRREGLSEASQALIYAWHRHAQALQRPQSIGAHLEALLQLLDFTGLHQSLASDEAGIQILALLRWDSEFAPQLATTKKAALHHTQHLLPQDFARWLDTVLESHSFKPTLSNTNLAHVLILPLHQMMGRDFAALVLPGCDEQNLPASPEPEGLWTPAQRKALGLPTRESMGQIQQQALYSALETAPYIDILWRSQDGAEARNLSPLLQLYWLNQVQASDASEGATLTELMVSSAPDAVELFIERQIKPIITPAPKPHFAHRPLPVLSASAYESLRRCPYQFFALQGLGLQAPDELDSEWDKSDFGRWLHEVLKDFHQDRSLILSKAAAPANSSIEMMEADLEASAQRVSLQMGLHAQSGHSHAAQFLPYALQWPGMRHAYAQWLQSHEAAGYQFNSAELSLQAELVLSLPPDGVQATSDLSDTVRVPLKGRLDRVDQTADGGLMVLDYKTGSRQRIEKRLKESLEDVQLAFYAELLSQHKAQAVSSAAYLSLQERSDPESVQDAVKLFAMPELGAAREALRHGLAQDWSRLTAGAALRALGEGEACDQCAARGLCRKDWRASSARPSELQS
jgi:ATP-dependent helicase/nuclease subunit B